MANFDLLTDEFWEVDNGDGTGFHVLNTLAFNISTLQGKHSIPPRRGDNFVPARRPGQGYVSKVRDARPLSLAMNILGRQADGTVPLRSQSQALTNYMTLQRLFAVYNRQITLRKRFYMGDGAGNFSLIIVTCQAETTGTMEYSPNGPTAGRCVIELTMHDPLWYSINGDSTNLTGQTTTDGFGDGNFGDGGFGGLIPVSNTVVVSGTAPSPPLVRFDGPVTNPSLTYIPPGGGKEQWLSLSCVIENADSVTVDMKARTITQESDSASHPEYLLPGSQWFEAEPGLVTFSAYAESTYQSWNTYVQWNPAFY